MRPYWLLFKRDIALASSHLADSLNPVLFFALVVLMFPLALGASQSLLTQVAPGLLWVAGLLSVLMSLERIFKDDLHEGLLAVAFKVFYGLVLLINMRTMLVEQDACAGWLCALLHEERKDG